MKHWRWLLIMAVIGLALAFYANQPDERVQVSFLDVGQGDAILIRQGSFEVLVDGGPSPQAISLALGKHLPFWDRTIELVVLTHPHGDHLAGLVEVLRRYRVEQVLEPPHIAEDSTDFTPDLYVEWRRLIAEKAIRTITARAYQELRYGQIVMEVLNPPAAPLTGTQSDADNNGVVLNVRVGDIGFLLTGDLKEEGEMELLMNRMLSGCTVLKVAHHGSKASSSQGFLNVVKPQAAVISVGENDFGHPSPEVLDRLKNLMLYRTDQDGTVTFFTDGTSLWVDK
jgi:competence protein ComEC